MHRPNKKQIIVICSILVMFLLTAGFSLHYETFLPKIMGTSDENIKSLPFRGTWSNATPTNKSWCEIKNNFSDQFLSSMRTNWSDWSYSKTVKCPYLDLSNYPKPRRKVSLDCSGPTPKLALSLTNDTRDIHQVKFGDRCLGDFINHCCSDDKPVPNVIHHVLFGGKEFGFFPFLSFMSATRFMKPCIHLIHGDYIPSGKYWDYFISITPNVIHVKSIPPTEVYGHKLAYPEHRADVLRIDVINKYGGVYTDWDEVLLKPLEPLRQYDCTMSELLQRQELGNAFIMTKKNSPFLNLWRNGYKEYVSFWGYNSQKVPYLLSQTYPQMIHIESHNFFKPVRKFIFSTNYNFSTNYGMHLAIRHYKQHIDTVVIRKLNVLMGAVSRHILFGDKDLCDTL